MYFGLPGMHRVIDLTPGKIEPDSAAAVGNWQYSIPPRFRTLATEQRGVVLENGRPLGVRAHSISDFRRNSGPMYVVTHGRVRFRAADLSDPRENDRTYQIRFPKPVKPWIAPAAATLMAAGYLLAGRVPGSGRRMWRWRVPGRDLLVASGLAAGVFIWRAAALADPETIHDGVMAIYGMPYSDAACWNEAAVNLADGRGQTGEFGGQRPVFPILIAAIHALAGETFTNGLWLNAVCYSLAVSLVFLAGRMLGSRAVGLAGAAILLFSGEHAHLSTVLMTETAGLFFTVLSLLLALLWHSEIRRPREQRRFPPPWTLVTASGLFFAIANLTCPFTLLAGPGYALLLWWAAARHRRADGPRRWLTAVAAPALFTAGFLIAVVPWMARQKSVYGVAAISLQTADLLYGATFDEGPFNPRQMQELEDTGFTHLRGKRYEYFMQRYAETVAGDPWGYARRLGRSLAGFFSFPDVIDPAARVAVVIVILAGVLMRWRSRKRLAWLAASAVVIPLMIAALQAPVAYRLPAPLAFLFGACVPVALLLGPRESRMTVLWLAATLAGCALTNALTGNLIARRAWVFADWNFWLLYLAAGRALLYQVAQLIARIAGIRDPQRADDTPWDLRWTDVRRFTLPVAGMVLASGIAAGAVLLPRKPVPEPPAGAEHLDAVRHWAERHLPATAPAARIDRIFPGDYRCVIPAREEPTNFSRAFRQQPFLRTMALVRVVNESGTGRDLVMAELPGDRRDLDPRRPYYLISLPDEDPDAKLGHDPLILKALAVIPAAADWAPITADALVLGDTGRAPPHSP